MHCKAWLCGGAGILTSMVYSESTVHVKSRIIQVFHVLNLIFAHRDLGGNGILETKDLISKI